MFAITERLLLRPGWAEDAPALARAIGEEAVVRNLARVPWPYVLGDAERFLAMPQHPKRPRFLITLRGNGELIGGGGLHGEEPEIAYWLARAHWGRGYATEAGRALIAFADLSLRLPRLTGRHAIDNPASGRVLRKLGFVAAGRSLMHSLARAGEMKVDLFARDRRGGGTGVVEPLAA